MRSWCICSSTSSYEKLGILFRILIEVELILLFRSSSPFALTTLPKLGGTQWICIRREYTTQFELTPRYFITIYIYFTLALNGIVLLRFGSIIPRSFARWVLRYGHFHVATNMPEARQLSSWLIKLIAICLFSWIRTTSLLLNCRALQWVSPNRYIFELHGLITSLGHSLLLHI